MYRHQRMKAINMKNGHWIGVGIVVVTGTIASVYGIKAFIEILKALQNIPI